MILDAPALGLSIGVQDILSILEETLREKNWKNFEIANFKLVYNPYYVFNYDVLVESDVGSQGFSGVMAIDAVSGKLEPFLTQILERQPVTYEKEITHDLKYEVEKSAFGREELVEACKFKLAGQLSVKKESLSVSGFKLVYWPIWHVFVTLPKHIQKIYVEAVAGQALNFEEVPVREKGWLEVTQDTLAKMKTSKGWKDLSKGVAGAAVGGAKTAVTKQAEASSRTQGIVFWLLHTKHGRYTLVIVALLILALVLMAGPQKTTFPGQ